jgi:hypothetical protein
VTWQRNRLAVNARDTSFWAHRDHLGDEYCTSSTHDQPTTPPIDVAWWIFPAHELLLNFCDALASLLSKVTIHQSHLPLYAIRISLETHVILDIVVDEAAIPPHARLILPIIRRLSRIFLRTDEHLDIHDRFKESKEKIFQQGLSPAPARVVWSSSKRGLEDDIQCD